MLTPTDMRQMASEYEETAVQLERLVCAWTSALRQFSASLRNLASGCEKLPDDTESGKVVN